MQKKLIALAVAGLVSAPVFAQSSVTIYGLVDMGFAYRGDNIDSGIGSKNAIDSGMASGSRLGFRGVEDLGNGLKAGFVLEQGINVDRGTSAQSGRSYGRQSYLSLGGNFGTVQLGRIYTPQKNLHSDFDPFGDGFVGKISNVYVQTNGGRIDNTLAYVSPSFGGLRVTAALSTQASGQEARDNLGDARVWAISPRYTNGPLDVAFNYHRVKAKGVNDSANKVWDLAAAYDFGVLKLAAMYGNNKDADLGDADGKFWMLGATVPVGAAGKVLVSYNRAKVEVNNMNDIKASQWALGYVHQLSKRTDLYAAYADINNRGNSFWAEVGDASNPGEGYQRGFNLGVRHRF